MHTLSLLSDLLKCILQLCNTHTRDIVVSDEKITLNGVQRIRFAFVSLIRTSHAMLILVIDTIQSKWYSSKRRHTKYGHFIHIFIFLPIYKTTKTFNIDTLVGKSQDLPVEYNYHTVTCFLNSFPL